MDISDNVVLVTEQDAGLYFIQITSRNVSWISLEAKMILDKNLRLERTRHQRLVTEEDYDQLGIQLYFDTRPVEVVKDKHRMELAREGLRIVSRSYL